MKMMTTILELDADLTEVSAALKAGAVLIIPTETVYGFACDAANEAAIKKIYALKERSEAMPMQLLLSSVEAAREIALFSAQEEKLARAAWPGEMTLILRPNGKGRALARGFETLGLRVPRHTFVSRLLAAFGGTLAATSANIHTKPPINKEAEIIKDFNNKADYIFKGGDIEGEASTVVQLAPFKILREGKLKKEDILKIIK